MILKFSNFVLYNGTCIGISLETGIVHYVFNKV